MFNVIYGMKVVYCIYQMSKFRHTKVVGSLKVNCNNLWLNAEIKVMPQFMYYDKLYYIMNKILRAPNR